MNMLHEKGILEMGGLFATGYGLYQAKEFHNVEYQKSLARHQEAIKLAKEQHIRDLNTVKQTYLLQLFNSLEQHFQQLNADLIASSKESERDMFDQRNQSFQTIILASSVMFSALSSIIVEGNLPLAASDFFFIAYALTSSLAFAFLFLSIVFSIEIIMRASSFMYKRAHKHAEQLRDAISKTKQMMKRIRGERQQSAESLCMDEQSARRGSHTSTVDENINKPYNSGNGKIGLDSAQSKLAEDNILNDNTKINSGEGMRTRFRRQISNMDTEAVENEWTKHEVEIQNYLAERERINDQTAVMVDADEKNSGRKSFQQFWDETCKFWAELSVLFFYAGSLNLLAAIMIFMWAQFVITYNSLAGAIIAVVLIGSSLIVAIALVIVFRRISQPEENISSINNMIEREKGYPRSLAGASPRAFDGDYSPRDSDYSPRESDYSPRDIIMENSSSGKKNVEAKYGSYPTEVGKRKTRFAEKQKNAAYYLDEDSSSDSSKTPDLEEGEVSRDYHRNDSEATAEAPPQGRLWGLFRRSTTTTVDISAENPEFKHGDGPVEF